MKKMTKGAIVTGLGVALLLGGGGTLATWNASVEAEAGSLVAGNLDLQATGGTWSNVSGPIANINTYRVVPGETLTFTQALRTELVGDRMEADLQITGLPTGDLARHIDYSENYTVMAKKVGGTQTQRLAFRNSAVPGVHAEADVPNGVWNLEGTVTLTFDRNAGNETMNQSYDLSDVALNLVQQAAS